MKPVLSLRPKRFPHSGRCSTYRWITNSCYKPYVFSVGTSQGVSQKILGDIVPIRISLRLRHFEEGLHLTILASETIKRSCLIENKISCAPWFHNTDSYPRTAAIMAKSTFISVLSSVKLLIQASLAEWKFHFHDVCRVQSNTFYERKITSSGTEWSVPTTPSTNFKNVRPGKF